MGRRNSRVEGTFEIGVNMRYAKLGTQLLIIGALVLLAAPVMVVVRRVQQIIEDMV